MMTDATAQWGGKEEQISEEGRNKRGNVNDEIEAEERDDDDDDED